MVGRDIKDHFPRPPWHPGDAALEVRNLRSSRVHDVSFTVRRGEILGFAGLVGAGVPSWPAALFGIDPIDSGEVLVDGRPVAIRNPAQARAAGIVLVPEDRKSQGLVMTGSVAYNLALPWTHDWIRGCLFDHTRRAGIVDRAMRGFAIVDAPVSDPELVVSQVASDNVEAGRLAAECSARSTRGRRRSSSTSR